MLNRNCLFSRPLSPVWSNLHTPVNLNYPFMETTNVPCKLFDLYCRFIHLMDLIWNCESYRYWECHNTPLKVFYCAVLFYSTIFANTVYSSLAKIQITKLLSVAIVAMAVYFSGMSHIEIDFPVSRWDMNFACGAKWKSKHTILQLSRKI